MTIINALRFAVEHGHKEATDFVFKQVANVKVTELSTNEAELIRGVVAAYKLNNKPQEPSV